MPVLIAVKRIIGVMLVILRAGNSANHAMMGEVVLLMTAGMKLAVRTQMNAEAADQQSSIAMGS